MKRTLGFKTAAAAVCTLLTTWLMPLFPLQTIPAAAISTDYPPQLINIASKDCSGVLTENGTADGSALTVQTLSGNLAGSWRFDRVGKDANGTFFKITSAESGRQITPRNYRVAAGNDVILYGSESHQTQHWYLIPTKNDRLGNGLYYKIVNYSDTSLALTQGKNGMTLSSFTGADNQLWLLNADGLQGFAGYCKNDNTGNIKASDIGGLFGEVVEVSNFNDLKKYATSDDPYTIVVSSNLKVTNLTKDSSGRYYCPDGRIYVHSNKTIIGSYNAHTLYNVQFCTATKNGTGNNLILKNFELQHDKESNGNDSIVVYFGSGENLWVDHCTFTGHSDYNTASTGLPDWDKFLACCYDADYCTVSDSSFGLHEYGLILGYPDDNQSSYQQYNNFPRMSIIGNQFNRTLTRGPGLMRYGYFHSLNNYVNQFSMAYTVHSASKIFAENCVYENGGNVICDWNQITYPGAYAESGSKFSGCGRTVQGQGTSSNPSYSVPNTWRPNTNYAYTALTADQAKSYCTSNSGCQSDKSKMTYLRFQSKGLPSAGFTEAPNGPTAAVFPDGAAYRIKNVHSGLYMQVEGASASNQANIQQWGSDGTSVHDIWKLCDAGNGYYYIVSCVGDGGTYVLDVAGRKTDNGTNIDLYQYNEGSNQQFMLTDNGDGSYKILTHISGESAAVEVADASAQSGANIQQWAANDSDCQNWILEPADNPGCKMDESLCYTFENVNSGYVMDIENGKMAEQTNVRQWESNGFDCQKWVLQSTGSGNDYIIRSLQDPAYMLRTEGGANGSNLAISEIEDQNAVFRFNKCLDGYYMLLSGASMWLNYVEVGGASKENGANIQLWEQTGSSCQQWNLQTEVRPTQPQPIIGDVNQNGICSIADVVLLQKWLCGVPNTVLPDWTAADLNADNRVNAIDLTILKRMLIA